ncbi:hypothetical protein PQX77_001639 [Marasmius sp. AFHP31]|nr:hypothetical protein PQX77_001639 [Marasmius sp. AFHP31]
MPSLATATATQGGASSESQQQQSQHSADLPRRPHIHSVGIGQGTIRLLQFSGVLATENNAKDRLAWWTDVVREYFTPNAIMKHDLWRENQGTEAKVYEMGVPALPRFFLGTTQSGVQSMSLTLDGARERLLDYRYTIVECINAVWTYNFRNGYSVFLKGSMTVHVVISAALHTADKRYLGGNYHLKFDRFEFEAQTHDKYVALEKMPTNISSSGNNAMNRQADDPVNAFGIPQEVMRCLEFSDSCDDMADLIVFSTEHELGPMDALRALGSRLREVMPHFQLNDMSDYRLGVNTSITTTPNPIGSGTVSSMTSTTATSLATASCFPTPTSISTQNAESSGSAQDSSPFFVHHSVPHIYSVGHGQALMRLLQFSGALATENRTHKQRLVWWNNIVREYFTPKATWKFTVWKDNQTTEAKVFEINVPVLPRYLLTTAQSGVKSMSLTLNGARERLFDFGHAVVECVSAVWTYHYDNGYSVLLKGPITVHVVITVDPPTNGNKNPEYRLRFENFEFEAKTHEKFVALGT